jgi:hypothetical protein
MVSLPQNGKHDRQKNIFEPPAGSDEEVGGDICD